jgi:hypothetical protein
VRATVASGVRCFTSAYTIGMGAVDARFGCCYPLPQRDATGRTPHPCNHAWMENMACLMEMKINEFMQL